MWAAWWAGFVVLDISYDRRHNHSTLSCVARQLFRTDTRAGRAAFLLSWAGLSGWLIPHILKDC